jgi:hypothetical protein
VPDRRDCHPVGAMPVLGSGKLDLKKLGDVAGEAAKRPGPRSEGSVTLCRPS